MAKYQVVLDTFSYGVYIVTCKAGDEINGLTLGWVMQLSFNPPLLAIAVNQKWHSHKLLSDGDCFVVHVLSEEQAALGKSFGTTHGWDTDKFEDVKWKPGICGVPVIEDCRAVLECRKVQEVAAGDHTLFIGEVIASKVDETKREQILNRKLYFESSKKI